MGLALALAIMLALFVFGLGFVFLVTGQGGVPEGTFIAELRRQWNKSAGGDTSDPGPR